MPTWWCSAAASPAVRPHLHLAKRGYRVALLEARVVGYGASGRSGGQTIFGLAASQKALGPQVGRDDARRLFDLSIDALDLTQSLIREYAIDCDYQAESHPCRDQAAAPARNWTNGLASCTRSTTIDPRACLDRDELRRMCAASAILEGSLTRAAAI